MKTIAVFLIPGLFLSGCYSQKLVVGSRTSEQYLSDVTDSINDRTAEIQLVTEEIFAAKLIAIRQDSSFWQSSETGLIRSIATSKINSISIKTHSTSNAIKGLGGGFLIGVGIGGILNLVIAVDDCSGKEQICIERGTSTVAATLLLGTSFGLVGLITGANIKTPVTYKFE